MAKQKQEIDVEKAIKMYQKHKDYMARRRVRNLLLRRKAEAAGITVSEKEIDEYLSKQK